MFLALSATRVTLGHSLSATVTVANTAGRIPTGTVSLRRAIGGTVIKTATLSGGKATITWTPQPRGTFQVYATYSGDANYASGRSGTKTYTVA